MGQDHSSGPCVCRVGRMRLKIVVPFVDGQCPASPRQLQDHRMRGHAQWRSMRVSGGAEEENSAMPTTLKVVYVSSTDNV